MDPGPDRRQNELPGVALPDFAEGHGHVASFGRQLETADLRGLSKEEVLDRVQAKARNAVSGEWIRSRGWAHGFWTPAGRLVSSEQVNVNDALRTMTMGAAIRRLPGRTPRCS
jgi:predicted amidohydrolase YtcJ